MAGLHIRAAEAADVAALAEALAPLPLFTAYGFTAAQLEERFHGALSRGEGLLVAARDSEPVGVCWFLESGTFATGSYLRLLAVKPGLQGQGVGELLLRAWEARGASAGGGLFLLASDFNEAAHRFYARHGYRETGRLPGFARPGVTEVIFWKPRAVSSQA
jgi:ribosomal protein S18 acetylase RimI-like enzyme